MAVGIGIYYKLNEDKRVLYAYIANSSLLSGLIYNKCNRFFVPYWFKHSLLGYMSFLAILGIKGIYLNKPITERRSVEDTIERVHYRYIKELASR
jgi:hypothetical protein